MTSLRLIVVLTSHFVSVLAGIKYLTEVTDGIIDERVTTVFYVRRIAAFDTWNDSELCESRSR